MLGVRPTLGRLLDESDDVRPGGHPVVVLSFDYWKTRMGAAADVIGRKVLVNSHPMTVIGVAAPEFRGVDFGEVASLWIPTRMKRQATPDFDWLLERRSRWLHVFGRLKPGVNAAPPLPRLEARRTAGPATAVGPACEIADAAAGAAGRDRAGPPAGLPERSQSLPLWPALSPCWRFCSPWSDGTA